MRLKMLTWAFVTAVAFTAASAAAQDAGLKVSEVWTRATARGAPNGAAYMTIESAKPDRLMAAASPAAERVELHTVVRDGDVMRMRQVESIELTPGAPTMLKPGGFHVMLLGLRQPLEEGGSVPLRLTFQSGAVVEVSAAIGKAGAASPAGGHGAPKHGS